MQDNLGKGQKAALTSMINQHYSFSNFGYRTL